MQKTTEPCRKCGGPRTFSGGKFRCLPCKKANAAEYRVNNKDQIKQWYSDNRESLLEKKKGYYQENFERFSALNKEYQQEHKDRIAAYQAEYRAAYYKANKEVLDAKHKVWDRSNPDKKRDHRRARRARVLNAEGVFTTQEWKDLVALYGGRCQCCGTSGDLHADHVVPISRGGDNNIGNIQPLCETCNKSKGTKTIDYRKGAVYATEDRPRELPTPCALAA